MTPLSAIRNFAIIAHVDHGKSTLADRLLEKTNTLPAREMRAQVLDTLDLERERGITIKLQPVQMKYEHAGTEYTLNLIDTPGHVDFSYEVNRTLAAVEGALLLVDASQGIEAQTLAHAEVALTNNLTLVPVINKIDLPNADPERVATEMEKLLGISRDSILRVSGKLGTGVEQLLEAIVSRIPAPTGDVKAPARALVFDSLFDPYRGVVAYVRVVDGVLKRDTRVQLLGSKAETSLGHVGVFKPKRTPIDQLTAGLTGYVETGLKNIRQVRVGDTLAAANQSAKPLPGYAPSEPKVYAALFPEDPDRYPLLKESLDRLALNDASLHYEPISSAALGAGFRVGFLGLLHLEIVQERLRREFNISIVSTTPNVPYRVTEHGKVRQLQSAEELTNVSQTTIIEEPWARVEIMTPVSALGGVLQLIAKRRGQVTGQDYVDPRRVIVRGQMPLAEVIVGLFDRLKSVSRGYASLHYELSGYKAADLVRLDVLIAGDAVEALAMIVPRERAHMVGRALTKKLKELVPAQQFAVPVQAAVGGKIVARETVSARRKDVTAKLYGGDVTRKRKLLEKQKAGKKRMAHTGRVQLPPEAFLKLLRTDFHEGE
jgi:GTP-binding protein LepA